MSALMGQLSGIPIYVSESAYRMGISIRRKTLRERWLSAPWQPWASLTSDEVRVPVIFIIGSRVVAHPLIVEELRRQA